MLKGSVKFYNPGKWFGFIIKEGASPEDRGSFIHASVLEKLGVEIKDGDQVEYEEVEGEKGMNVTNIKLA